MRVVVMGIMLGALCSSIIGAPASGVHVYWYKASTNAYDLQADPGPALPANAIIHEGKIASCDYSVGFGVNSEILFGCGSGANDDQGWSSAFWSANLNDAANAGGHADSAFLRGEYSETVLESGAHCQAGPISIKLGVVDVSMGILMWGGPENVTDGAIWSDLDPFSTLDFRMTSIISGTEGTLSFTAEQGRDSADAPRLLAKKFVKINVTDQVNYILQHAGGNYAIVLLSDTGSGSTGKFMCKAYETCTGGDTSLWTQDGNTIHLLLYGSADDAVDAEKNARQASGMGLSLSPNPFNPAVTITLPVGGAASLLVYDTNGRIVADITDKIANRLVAWDASGLPSGMYIFKARMGKKTYVAKAMLMK